MTEGTTNRIITGLLFFFVLVLAAPVSAAIVTIDNTTPGGISQALIDAGDGGTVILRPGIYFENSTALTNSTTIKADITAGGSAANTIIDAERSGRIFDAGGHSLIIDSLTLRNGKVPGNGAAIYAGSGGSLIITSCEFTSCRASVGFGGAIFSDGGSVTVTSSTFTNCRSEDCGGAIYSGSGGSVTVASSTFTECWALLLGGAIYSNGGVNVDSSIFTDCSAIYGGGAIFSNGGGSMQFSRIYDCDYDEGAMYSNLTFNAKNNWWGANEDPSASVSGNVIVDPWLVLGAVSNPATITIGETPVVRASLTHNSAGVDTSGGGFVPDGLPVAFELVSGSGSLSMPGGDIINGMNSTAFTPAAPGTVTINVTVNDQTVSTLIHVTSGAPFTASPPATSSGGGGSNTDTGIGVAEYLKAGESESFLMDKGAVYKVVIIAKRDIDRIMITVRKKDSLPASVDPPEGEVYEYEDVTLYYVEDSDLSGRTFYFRVKKNWLSSNGYDYNDIVMMRYNEDTGDWESLSTTLIDEDQTYYYYSSETPSFSFFAIAVIEGATIVSEEETTPAATEVPAPEKTSAYTAASTQPAEKAVTAPPEEGTSLFSGMLLLTAVVLALIVIVGLVCRRRRGKYPEWWDHGKN